MKLDGLATIDTQATDTLVYDRLVKEKERVFITGISKAQAFQLERRGEFPRRRRVSNRSVAWLHSELLEWVKSRDIVISPTERETR
ncbi:AlpA family phage regulatory protein [Shewanella sp. A25]|nr:AlpA family phage regulatory protein [Shewanella shenzhenensis]